MEAETLTSGNEGKWHKRDYIFVTEFSLSFSPPFPKHNNLFCVCISYSLTQAVP